MIDLVFKLLHFRIREMFVLFFSLSIKLTSNEQILIHMKFWNNLEES